MVRQGDGTTHGGVVTTGSPTVLVEGKPAARQGDFVICPLVTGLVPHVGGTIALGNVTVLVNGLPIAQNAGLVIETGGIPSTLLGGATTVMTGN